MSKTKSKAVQAAYLAMAITTAFAFGCTDEDDGGFDDSYENTIELTCNGTVLVDETFTSREACESFRDNNTFDCNGTELTISC